MKDLIAKLQMDANCALGAIWMHIDAREKRIAELEAQIAARPADTDKLHNAIMNLPCTYTNEVAWDSSDRDKAKNSYLEGHRDARHAAAELVGSTALQAPVREVQEGMPVSQEPKYGIRDNRLFNRASGEVIPEDEPVFIFRARDTHAVNILAGYAREVLNAEHASAVWGRVDDFKRFWDANPDRMKQPDTALPAAPVQPDTDKDQA